MTKSALPGRRKFHRLCARLALTSLLGCISISSNAGNPPFVINPCLEKDAGTPGNCPSVEPLGMALYQTGPSITYNADHSMSLFVRDGNAYLALASQMRAGAAPWQWQNLLYGGLNSDPVVISRNGGDLDAFYIGLNEAVWHIRQSNGQWGNHTIIGGGAGGQVTVAYTAASDTAQLFYKGDDQSLMTIIEKSGTWSKPSAILPPQSVTSNIASLDVAAGNRYLFFRGIDGSLKIVSLTPGSSAASPPFTLTKPWAVTGNITPMFDASGNIIVFYRGPDSALWDVSSTGSTGWGYPTSLGGRASSDLFATFLPGKRLRVYYRSTDGGVYYVQQEQGTTTGWGKHKHLLGLSANAKDSSGAALLSQTLFSNPVAGVTPDGRQEVFYTGNDGNLWHTEETATSSPQQLYPAWTPQTSLRGLGTAPRGNTIVAFAATGAQPIASYNTLDAATIYRIIGNAPFLNLCLANPMPVIGFGHRVASCYGMPIISRAMGIALLQDDIQTAITAVKANTKGSVTQAQFDALIKAQLQKMGIL